MNKQNIHMDTEYASSTFHIAVYDKGYVCVHACVRACVFFRGCLRVYAQRQENRFRF